MQTYDIEPRSGAQAGITHHLAGLDIWALLALIATVFAGCGGGTQLVKTGPPPPPPLEYHAYGDSITYGFLLHDPRTQAYPVLVAADEHVTAYENYAIPGHGACDVAKWQIAANQDSPTLATHPVYTLLIGTNDIFHSDAALYESTYTLCYRGVLTWLAVPREFKVLAGDSGVATSGSGALQTIDGWSTWTTQGAGATVSFAITTTRNGPIYAWPMIIDGRKATYNYAVDGVVVGQGMVSTDPPIATQAGTTGALGFIRLPDVPAGKHVVTFTQTSDDESGVAVVGVGTPDGEATGRLPAVLAGTIPYQYYGGKKGPCTPGEPLCLSYIQAISNSVNLFHSDGLDVRLFDTRKYMLGTADEMTDSLHPNALGHEKLRQSVEAVWK